jgi:hypothetical protein
MTTERRCCAAIVVVCAWLASSCGAVQHVEGLDSARLPVAMRSDYEVFADRCSRCHSLSRPLDSGITDMDHWRNYVTRMRRQPSSGIAPDDVDPILRFLAYYSVTLRGRVEGL